jgi:hypothetical protein
MGSAISFWGSYSERWSAPLVTRLQTMETVIEELDRIEAWERKTPLLAVSSTGLDAAAQLRQNAIERSQVREANLANWEETERRLTAVRDSVLVWVRSELTEVASQFGDGTALRMEVHDAILPTNEVGLNQTSQGGYPSLPRSSRWPAILNVQTSQRGGYRSIGGVELLLREASDGFHRRHLLQVLLCQEWQVVVTVSVVIPGVGGDVPESAEPPRDVQLALIPLYRQTVDHEAPRASQMLGYLSRPEKVGTNLGQLQMSAQRARPGQRQPPSAEFFRVEPVTASFHHDVTQFAPFRLSEWPARQEELRRALATAVGACFDVVQKGIRLIGR